jgi:hypothetical protein
MGAERWVLSEAEASRSKPKGRFRKLHRGLFKFSHFVVLTDFQQYCFILNLNTDFQVPDFRFQISDFGFQIFLSL